MNLAKWLPSVGFHDLANLAADEWQLAGGDGRGAVHASISPVILFGLARHAAIGRQRPLFVEIGVQKGSSTRALLTAAAMLNGRVYSMEVDPACGVGPLREWVDSKGLAGIWSFAAGRSQDLPVAEGADLLFVDGDHGYEAVCSDMARHGTAVRDGGLIVLDDYYQMFPGKQRWLQERWGKVRPLTIGPLAVLVKAPDDDTVYREQYPAWEENDWLWQVELEAGR